MNEFSAPESALQKCLDLAKESQGSNVSTLRSIVLKIISEPDLFYGYDEIKSVLSTSLTGAEGKKLAQALDLFSYGTLDDYTSIPDHVLPLNDSATFKLRQLSLLSLVQKACMQKKSTMGYQEVQEALQIPSDPSVLEDVVMSCIYSGVLRAKIHQQHQIIRLYNDEGPPVASRDVPLHQVPNMLQAVQALAQDKIAKSISSLAASERDVTQDILSNKAFTKLAAESMKKDSLRVMSAADARNRRAKRSRGGRGSGDTSMSKV